MVQKMWNESSDPDKPMIGLFLIGCVQMITMTISENFRVRIKK